MRPLHGRLLAALLVALPAAALAEPVGYATGFDQLYRIDLGTGQATLVGPLGFIDVEGLAFSPDGVLYGVADSGRAPPNNAQTDFLLRIDTTTGAATAVGQMAELAGLGPGQFGELDYGLAFTCDGRLWLTSDTIGQLWEVDPETAAVRHANNIGILISGLAGRGNALYGLSVNGFETLYRVPTEGAFPSAIGTIGAIGLADRMYDAGLDFDADGNLWATVDYFSPPVGIPLLRNDIVRLDPTTGAILEQRPITGAGTGIDTVQMEGLAIALPGACTDGGGTDEPEPRAVPGPGLPLLLTLSGVFGWSARRRLRAER